MYKLRKETFDAIQVDKILTDLDTNWKDLLPKWVLTAIRTNFLQVLQTSVLLTLNHKSYTLSYTDMIIYSNLKEEIVDCMKESEFERYYKETL